jgi:two-component system NtrC family sensor kinase
MLNGQGSKVALGAALDGMSDGTTRMPDETELRMVFDLVPHIVWLAGRDGSIEYFNRRASEYVGVPPGTYLGSPTDWLATVHPDDIEQTHDAWLRAIAGQTEAELNYRIRRADGVYRWHCTRAVPVRDPAGDLTRWIGTCTDIEDQKALEGELRRAQRETAESLILLETLQTNAPIGFGFIDREQRIIRVNDMIASLSGIPAHEQVGRLAADAAPHVWPAIERFFHQVLESGEPVRHIEITRPTDSNSVQSLLISYYPVRVEDDIAGVGIVVADVTEHRQAEEFRSVVMDNMAEGLFTVDEQGRLTSLNRAAASMFGWEEADLLGRDMHETVHSKRPDGTPLPALDCPIHRVRATGGTAEITDEVFVRNDGSVFPVRYSAAPLHIGDKVAGAVVVFRDATEQRRQQQRVVEDRHDQKLEALGRLSAGLAHEINTPIQFVGDNTRFLAEAYQQMLELLLVYRGCMGPDSGQLPWEERKRLAEEAEEVADIEYLASEVPSAVAQSLEGMERVASLVKAMKAFSYKDTKNRAYADLNEAIKTTVIVARNEVKYVADVVLDLADIPEVLCHVGDLNQVFLNLLVNAADAMEGREDRGEIKISTRVEDRTVVIAVADDGAGIPEEIQKTIFEPFFTTKEVGKGTGQGLALAVAVCEKHGGSIEVDSKIGHGTTFTLRLPIAGKRVEAA